MATEEFFVELNRDHPNHMALYIFPESAVNALAALDRYRVWREKPVGEVKRFDVRSGAAEELIQEVRQQGRRQLTRGGKPALDGVLRNPRGEVRCPPRIAEELEARGQELRYPVVLKAVAPDLVHKMDAGGVIVDLRGPEELLAAAQKMTESVARHRGGEAAAVRLGFLVQEYVRGGREVIVGMTHDPKYGPLVMFGLGGIYVETLKDVVFRVPPLTDLEAHEMIRQIRGFNLLRGVRGEAPVDLRCAGGSLAEVFTARGGLAGNCRN